MRHSAVPDESLEAVADELRAVVGDDPGLGRGEVFAASLQGDFHVTSSRTSGCALRLFRSPQDFFGSSGYGVGRCRTQRTKGPASIDARARIHALGT